VKIIDLSVPIGPDTPSPPSAGHKLLLTSYHKGPTFWQASKVEMLLHTGSHVDFPLHIRQGGLSAAEVTLDSVCGRAVTIDLGDVGPNYPISRADIERKADRIRAGDIVLVRTGWTDRMWGVFPSYYLESPYCEPEAAKALVGMKVKAVGFDCFPEYAARLSEFTSEDFIIHRVLLDNGAMLMQHLTNLKEVPSDRSFIFFAPFIKIRGAEGSPARFFALVET